MYLKLIILLFGLKLCHTTNETFINEQEDDKLFNLLREQGKNQSANLMEMYQNDSPYTTNDDEWDQILAHPYTELDIPTNYTSDENIDEDLKNLISLGELEDLWSNDAPYNDDQSTDDDDEYENGNDEDENEPPPYDKYYLENFDDVLTTENDHPYKLDITPTDTPKLESETDQLTSYHPDYDPNNEEVIQFTNRFKTSYQNSGEEETEIDDYILSSDFSQVELETPNNIQIGNVSLGESISEPPNVSHVIQIDDLDKIDLKKEFPNLYGKRTNNQRSLAFVFDSTGSMWDDLQQLKDGAEKIMAAMEERDDNPIYNYILVPFHDPKVGPVTITKDRELFRQKLEEIDVYGGGDCPEMSLGGISKAIDASLPKSYIYVLTDATAADHFLVGNILDKVLQKEIQVVFVLTGDCNNRTSPEYTVYEKIAAASSGQVFHLSKSDVNQILDFVRKTLDSRRENLLVVTNVSPTNKSPHKVAVDSSLDQLTISVSGTNPKIDVVNPEGEHVNEPPKVEQILNLENIKVVNVNNPSNGSWEINVSSGSDHSIRLSGLTDLRIDHGFSVIVPKSMDETNHRPLYGKNTYLLLKPSNNTTIGQISSVDLIGLDGQPLKHNIPLTPLSGSNSTYISENFRSPNSFFNLFIKGEDKEGNPFVRLTTTAIKPQYPEKPFVTIDSADVFHTVHVPLNLSCHVETLVPAIVQWFKNGKAVSDRITKEQTGWFHWSDFYPNFHTAGLYTCKAENEAGINSENIQLHIIEPPKLKKLDKAIESLEPGTTFYADCYAIAGNPSPGIEWMKNEMIITSDTNIGLTVLLNGTLVIPYVATEHEGEYQCIASNLAGVDTNYLTIRVEVAPSFSTDNYITKIDRLIDTSLELHCQADGVPKPFITWLKDETKLLPNKQLLFLNDNSTLIIPQLETNQSGLYSCIAFNRVGSINKSITVSVIVPPNIQSSIIDDTINVIEGETVTLPCLVFGDPKPNVSWVINSTLTHEILNENSNISFVANSSNTGTYECVATNVAGTDSRLWTVVVFTPPIIKSSFDEIIELRENEKMELVCRANGFPKPTIKWTSDRLLDQTILENETLTVIGKRDETPVKYMCTAENSAGIVNKTITVIVKAVPKIKEDSYSSINILENTTLISPCTANGNPIPNITWYKNGNLIHNDSTITIHSNSTLVISSILRNLTGVFKCEAVNSEGTDFIINNVTVLVPPKVLNSAVNNIEVIEGKSIQIKCPVSDSFPPPEIKWFKNGNNVENTLVPKNQTQNNFLFIQTTTITDDGIYICVATNIAGTAEAQIYLTVLYRPKIKNKHNPPQRIKKHTGDIVELKCEADGNPTPKLQWIRSKTILSKNNSALSIKNLKISDRDNYTCQASNAIGNDENVYFLDVLEPPKIHGPLNEHFDVIRGETSVIQCEVTGYPQPGIKWSKPSTDISLNELGITIINDTLKIVSMDYKHQGSYLCEAINTEGISTKSVMVNIKVKPAITVTPENKMITVKENEKFVLECFVEGIPKPELHWDKNGVELTQENFQREFTARSSPMQSNTTRYTLTARNVTSSLDGIYHCNATSTLGKTSEQFNVSVLTSPKLKLGTNSQNNSIEVIENSPGIFKCNIDLGNPPSEITWYWNDKKLTDKSNDKIQFESHGSILNVFKVNEADSGTYKCQSSNPIGKVEQLFQLDVLVPPKSESVSQVPIDIVIGDDLKLYCDISGHPKPSIMWLKESSPIEKVKSNEELLVLKNSTIADGGEYTCVALNKAGSSKMSFNVKVLEPPKFLDTLPAELNINGSVEHGFVLRCDIGGDPPPNITWEKDGRPIFNRPENISYHISSDQAHLQISNPQISDAGKYLCEAQNSVGILRRQFNVFLKVMANWNTWSKWNECSTTCGEGIRKRNRSCNYPEEFKNSTVSIDMSKCTGPIEESQSCFLSPCAVNGQWSYWTAWTSCSTTCGSGFQYRYRYCNNPTPAYGGANCSGPSTEQISCNDRPCPKDGDWSIWSQWGPCSTTCGTGVRLRTRKCDSPKPAYGGKECNGNYVETLECNQEPCSIDGGWSDWQPWSTCTTTCGLGRKIRKRYCTNPVPKYGGKKCIGEPLMITGCVLQPCFVDTKPTEYSIHGNISGRKFSNHISVQSSMDGSEKTLRFKSLQEYKKNKDGWLPSLVFLVSPMSMNMVMLENADQSEEDEYDDNDYSDENEFEQDSKISFQTGQELIVHQQGKKNLNNGVMEVTIELKGEAPIIQEESKLIIDPFTESYIPTSRNIRRSSSNNYLTIDGKPVKYSWDNQIKYKKHPQLKKLVEKVSTENIAANYNPNRKEWNLVMTTNVEDDLDCPNGYETDRSKNICKDINECNTKRCHSTQICENTIGSYKCSCRVGYKSLGNGYRCLDINECILDIHECSHNCENLPGGYTCKCPHGMILGSDRHTCFTIKNKKQRSDWNTIGYMNPRNNINEFSDDYQNSYSNEMEYPVSDFSFLNTSEECPTGFYQKDNECLDINECLDNPKVCSISHTCLNTKGAYMCIPAPCPEYSKRNIRTSSCIQFCNDTSSVAICSDNAEISQTISYKTLSIAEKDIVLDEPLMTLNMETFGRRSKYVSYILQDSSSEAFEVFNTRRGLGILTCYIFPERGRVHRLTAIGNAYKNAKKTKLLHTTKYIIHVYVFD